MTHQFIVNTENVNSYGYRILTDGIDYEQYLKNPIVLYYHERNNYKERGGEVIGRCVKLYKEDQKLIAEIEFDKEDDFAKRIAGKVERGFVRMASIYAERLESSSAPELLIEGQTLETVTKAKLIEISIVDVGGNDDALKLGKKIKNNQPIALKRLNQKQKNMSGLKTIALALNLKEDANDAIVLQSIHTMKTEKEKAEKEAKTYKEKFMALQKTEATILVNKAVELGLVDEGLKYAQLKALEADFEAEKIKLSQLISGKEQALKKHQRQERVGQFLGLQNGNSLPQEATDSFDYLQKNNPVELRRIHNEEPEKYAQLAADYAKGVRYSK